MFMFHKIACRLAEWKPAPRLIWLLFSFLHCPSFIMFGLIGSYSHLNRDTCSYIFEPLNFPKFDLTSISPFALFAFCNMHTIFMFSQMDNNFFYVIRYSKKHADAEGQKEICTYEKHYLIFHLALSLFLASKVKNFLKVWQSISSAWARFGKLEFTSVVVCVPIRRPSFCWSLSKDYKRWTRLDGRIYIIIQISKKLMIIKEIYLRHPQIHLQREKYSYKFLGM